MNELRSHTTTEAPPSFATLIEQARSWPNEGFGEGRWFHAMADWMERAHTLLAQANQHVEYARITTGSAERSREIAALRDQIRDALWAYRTDEKDSGL